MKLLKSLAICIGLSLAIASPAMATYGKIIIKKKALPQDAQDFAFTISNHNPSGFFLDDDNNPTLSNQKTFVLHAGNYKVTEQITPGWRLKSIHCTSQNGSNNNTIDLNGRNVLIRLQYNEIATCTFTNEKMIPTSAPIIVSGKIMTANGSGIPNARVRVTDLSNGTVYNSLSSSFGYYSVDGPTAGAFIDVSVTAKGRTFESKQMSVVDNVSDLDFIEIRSKYDSKSRDGMINTKQRGEFTQQAEKTLEEINDEIIDARVGTEDNL